MAGQSNGLGLIKKLMEFGALAKEGDKKCIKGHLMSIRSENQSLDKYKWSCSQYMEGKRCGYSQSLRSGTFFFKSKLTFEQIMIFARYWVNNCSLNLIKEEIEVNGSTAVDYNNFFREICIEFMLRKAEKIGGVGHTVEIDESKFGKRKYHRGHQVEGQWIFGGIDRETGKVFMVPVESRDAATLQAACDAWIEKGTTIISDCWKVSEIGESSDYSKMMKFRAAKLHHLRVIR